MLSRRALLGLLAGGCLVPPGLPALVAAAVPRGGQAPDFVGIDGWLNTATPITRSALRGRVVLVEFWTYSCINCRRTVPYLNRWQEEYGPHGFEVIGIHTPEFGFEHERPDVAAAVTALGIRFPVGQDNEYRSWQAWGNEAWPSFYLLDRAGRIVLLREGEGNARELEDAIRAQLGLSGAAPPGPGDDPDLARIGSPEVYFGAAHPTPQDPAQSPRWGEATYHFPPAGPALDRYQLDGTWTRKGESLTLRSSRGGLRIRFSAGKLHLVAAALPSATLSIRADGRAVRTVEIREPTLYTLFESPSYGEHRLDIEAEGAGLSLFNATFG
ncbi:redoxin domain-containing protein [Acidisoma sp. 7E03]